MSYQRILLPVSGKHAGERACKALFHAVNLCAENGEIVLLHVGEPLPQRVGGEAHDELKHDAQIQGEKILAPVLKAVRETHVACKTVVMDGTPARTIVKAAHENNCDIIVMFTDGHDSLSDILLGGVTERVLRNTDVPLLAIRK